MAKETKKVTKKEEKPVDKKVTKKEEESKKKQVETKKKQEAKKKQESSEEESSEEESSEEEKEEKEESSEEESSEEEKEEKEESSEEESSDEEKEEKDEEEDEEEEDEEEEDEEEEDEEEEDEEEEEKVGQKRKQSEDGEQPSKKQAVGSSKVFVGSLSFTTTDDSLKKAFSKYGKVTFSRVSMNDQGRSKGFGFVEFDKEESAQKALEMNGADLDGRQIKVEISQGSRDTSAKGGNRGSTGGSGEATKVLFVGNLSFQTSKDSLYAAFEGFEGLQDARVATDKESGRPRGFGYLEFADAANAKEAFEQMNGADVDGRNIRLDYAAERTGDAPRGGDRGDRGDRGGFRGGFRGGRGGDRGGFGGGRGGRGGDRGGFRGGRGGDRGGFRGGRGGDRGGFRGGRGGGSGYEGRKTTFDD